MELLTIPNLRKATQEGPCSARLHLQVQGVAEKVTREGKPYREIAVADAQGAFTLRAWSDAPAFSMALAEGDFLEIEGEFSLHPAFGLEGRRWAARPLEPGEVEALLGGPPELREKQARDWESVRTLAASVADPRLHALCELFLADFGERFRRAAAARTYHHARRGGLVEHVAAMMRAADALCTVYPALNRDLLLTGTLLHDSGKLWENCPEPLGFGIPYDERGELVGHITIGVELANALWRKLLKSPTSSSWATLHPASEEVRLHLLHLIAAHHGQLDFGSPVVPKTPEAHALHYIDNLDAKLEMVFAGYETGTPLGPQIVERVRPLPGNLIRPLPSYTTDASAS